jgi:UMF1 family MFS transporter
MLRLSPPEQVGAFFGLYGIAGKLSAVSGPLLYGSIVSTLLDRGWGAGAYQVGIFSFLILLVIGVVFLRGVPEPPAEGHRSPSDRPGVPPPEGLAPVTAPIELD